MTVTLYALVMTFGALVAVAGLVLLFTRKEEGRNTIRILGWEFQISTPALVVLLAGCALVIMPPALRMENVDVFTIGDGPRPDGNHVLIKGEEKEPNDDPDHANVITVGSAIRGAIATPQDRDFFKFQSPTKPAAALPKLRVIMRKMFNATVTIYNEHEEKVAGTNAYGEDTLSFAFEVAPGAYYYLIVEGLGDHGTYELLLKEE